MQTLSALEIENNRSETKPVTQPEFTEETSEGVRPLTYDDKLAGEPESKGRAILLLSTGLALLVTGVVMNANSGGSLWIEL